jgi:hypothetical protein
MCPLHMQSNCSYVFMNQVHGRKRDDFARFQLSIALVLAYVQAVGALHGVIVISLASPRYPQTCCLDSAATIGLYRLDCIIKSAFSVWVGILIDRACLDRTWQQERGVLYISPQPTGTRTERFPPISLFFQRKHSKWTCLSRRMLLTLRSVCTYHRYSAFQGQRIKPGMESSILLAPDRILSFKAVSKFSVPRSSNINFRDPKPGIINVNSNLRSGTSSIISSTSDRETAAKLRCHPSICSMDSGIPRVKLPSTGLNSFRSNLFYVSNFDQRAPSG